MTGVIRQLVNAGIPYDSIPKEWSEAIVAATVKWLTNTREGVEDALSMFNIEYARGSSEKEYFVTDENETRSTEIPPDDVLFIRGIIAKGFPISPKRLSISVRDLNQCEDCGVSAHCLVDVRCPGTDKIRNLCNKCVTYHENPRVQDLGSKDRCYRCSVSSCPNHPHKTLSEKLKR